MYDDINEKLVLAKMYISDAQQKCKKVQIEKLDKALALIAQAKALSDLRD